MVQGEVLLPAGLASFEKLRLEVTLWEYDPRLADASATRFDEVVVKDYAHTKGKDTRTAFTLGEKVNGGKTNAGKAYYLTVFVTQRGKRTHIGEKDGKPGLCMVLTDGNPNEVTLTLRAVAEKQPVRRSKEWSGSVEDEKLAKDAPACITTAKALEKLWEDWKLTDKLPDIDFTKELVVVSTARGSRLPRSPRPSSTFRTSSSPGTQGTVGSGLRRAGLPLAGLAHGRGLAHHLVGQLDHAPVGLSHLRYA
jgi:hypothetical protein